MSMHSISCDIVRAVCFPQANNLWILLCVSAIKSEPNSSLNHNNAIGGVIGIVIGTKALDLPEDWLKTSLG